MQLFALGMFAFGRESILPDTITDAGDWRHEMTARVGARPAAQFLGPGQRTVTLTGVLVPEILGDRSSLTTLEEMADIGDAYSLIDGEGRKWGEYVIRTLDADRTALIDNGAARRIEFRVGLERVA